MSKVVLTQKAEESAYDDVVGQHYHFPRTYLRTIESAVGDLCVFYEPRRGGGLLSYNATARIVRVRPDSAQRDHFYADLDNFIWFTEAVPLRREDGKFWEAKLQREDGKVNRGAAGRAVRAIPQEEFELILRAGFVEPVQEPQQYYSNRERNEYLQADDKSEPFVYRDASATPPSAYSLPDDVEDARRPLIERLVTRPFRDRVFARQVCRSYDSRCAITGLKLVNGGGRTEAEAAHIRPVEHQGPDTVRNGLALSRTVHWMFDRGLVSVDDDFRLLKAKRHLPEGVERLFDPSGYIRVPEETRAQPSAIFLRWHRENCFKG